MSVEIRRHRFSVKDFHRLGEVGVLKEDERVELIDGEIVCMTPVGSAHAACVKRLLRRFALAAGQRAIVAVQDPIALGPDSEPQQDLALLHPRSDLYASAHPGPEDVWLIVEVADTSLGYDRSVKIPLYAKSGIPEVWLVDSTSKCIEVHRRPSEAGYREIQRLRRGESLTCQTLPDVSVSVDEVLG